MNCCSPAVCKYDKTVTCQGRKPTTDGKNSPDRGTGSFSWTVVKLKTTQAEGSAFSKELTGVAADNVWVRMKYKGCDSSCLPDTP